MIRGLLADRESILVASDRLEDCGALAVDRSGPHPEALRIVKIAQRFREAMKRGSHPRASE
jgi:hypothetical protein